MLDENSLTSGSDSHQLSFLMGDLLVDDFNLLISELLDLFLGALKIIFSNGSCFLELLSTIHCVATAGADANASFLRNLVDGADQILAAFFGEFRRDLALQRQAVIASNPELRERELAKLADWAIAIAAVLRERGVTEPQATLAAETGMAVLRVGLQRWASDENDQELTDIMRDAMADVRALAAGS